MVRCFELGSARATRWLPWAAGVVAGLSLGWSASGWVMLAAAGAMVWALSRDGLTPARMARMAAAFAAGLTASAISGFASGLPDGLRLPALVPEIGLVACSALAAALAAWLACRVASGPWMRWGVAWPAAWLLQEWVLGLGALGMPWVRIGYAQATAGPFAPLAGWFSVGGVLVVSALTWVVAALGVLAWQRRRAQTWRVPLGLAVAIWLAGVAFHAAPWTGDAGKLVAELRSARIDVHAGRVADAREVEDWLRAQRRAMLASRADLVVLPQLALPSAATAVPQAYWESVDDGLAARGADALVGLYLDGPGDRGLYNGAVLLGASGMQRYAKSRLFPFGEFLPFGGGVREWAARARGFDVQDTLSGPEHQDDIWAAGRRVSLAICFEVAFGDEWRARSQQAELLINMASDSTEGSPQLVRQSVAHAAARALELRKPVLRSSDTEGGAVHVSADGRIQHMPDASVVVHARRGLTPYALWGDAMALGLALLGLALAMAGRTRSVGALAAARGTPGLQAAPMRGQVLPAAVGMLLVIGGVFYLMVNSGQTTTEKIRVTNAADAAAYSAAVVEARALNYDAYVNRAVVANEIAIAQMVSLASWLDYFATAADNYGSNISDTNFFVLPNPKVVILSAALVGTNYISAYTGTTAQEYADYIIEYGLAPIITLHNGVAVALAASQKLVQLNLVAGIRQQQIANDVVKAMDPKLKAELVLPSHGFDNFTKNYGKSGGTGDERGRLADVVTRSRDPFTKERNWTASGFDIPFIRKDGALKKRGGTELIGYDEWRAVDTLELHGRTFGCGKLGLSWCSDIQRPIGWGATEVDAGGGDAGHGYHGNAYNENETTAKMADSNIRRPSYAYFSGIPDSRELRNLDPAAEIATGVTIRVSKSHNDLLTSGGAAQAKPSGSLELFNDKPAGGEMVALARAQVFFDRIAARADGKTELGSLYNPYWRVRLVAPTAADKAYAAAKQKGMVLP